MKSSASRHMRDISRRVALVAIASLASQAASALAQASDFPAKVVHIVVPSSPGGSLDAVARVVGQKLSEIWRQPVIIDNKPGANFAIGASFVARAPADGYTLLYAHDGPMAMNPVLYQKLSYDPQKELTPIGRVVELPIVLYVNKSSPCKSFGEFMQALRAAPGKFNHANGGTATMMSSELFKSVAGVQYAEVPFKGGGPAVTAVAAGEADFTFADPGSAAAMLQGNRIRALATASPKRLPSQPRLPSITETVPGYATVSWSGLHAPAGTPAAVIRKINADLLRVLAQPETKARLEGLGVEVDPSSPEELAAVIRSDTAKWAKLVK